MPVQIQPPTLEEQIAQALEIRNIYLPIPHMLVRDVFGDNTWSMQDEIVKSVFKYKTTAVKTCNAVGKSFIAARVALAFLTLYEGSIVVTTAPTWRQVKDVLWREFAIAVKRSKFPLTKNEVRQAGLDISEDWFAVGLSTKYPDNFFGYHANHILVIVDEAGGVEEPIFKGVKAITPNANARILYIGNPTTASGTFYDAFTNLKLPINRITVSAFDSPNFVDTGIRNIEDLLRVFTPPAGQEQADWTAAVNTELEKRMNPSYRALIDPSVVYERYHEWGLDSPAWQSLVMGEFPTESDQALIPTNLVTMAMNMYGTDDETGESYAEMSGWNIPDGLPEYGQDMARFGSDATVCTPRRGGWVDHQISWNKVDLMDSANRILKIINPLDRDVRVNIDDTGNGGGTTDRLRQISHESFRGGYPAHQYQIVAYNFSSKELMKNPKKFHDVTSELYWNLRTQFIKKRIALYYDKQLFNELVGRRWGITTAGKIKVESKDDYKKRTGGKSPDKSDSLALAFAGGIRNAAREATPEDDEITRRTQELTRPVTSGLQDRY